MKVGESLEKGENLSQRDLSVDLIKAFAVAGIVMIHSCSRGYQNPVLSFNWLSAVLWGSLMRAGVPLFLMCTGALFLNKQRVLSLRKLYLHNIPRLLAAMIFWAMLYKAYALSKSSDLSVSSLWFAFKQVLLFKQEFHLYYIQIALLLYVLLPILKVFTEAASKKQLEYALLVWFAFGILYPTLKPFWPFSLLSGIPVQYLLNMSYASAGYALLGHYLKEYPLSKKLCIFSSVFGVVFIFAGTCLMSYRRGGLYEGFFEGFSVGVFFLALGNFGYLSQVKIRSALFQNCLVFVSKSSFCIYLVHIFFLYFLLDHGFSSYSFPLLTSPAIAAAVFLPSLLVYVLLSKIPVVNKWII